MNVIKVLYLSDEVKSYFPFIWNYCKAIFGKNQMNGTNFLNKKNQVKHIINVILNILTSESET